jgi:hypothetical protein
VQDLAGNLEISNPATVSVAAVVKKAAMDGTPQKEVPMPKLPARILQQGFWSAWKRLRTDRIETA